MRIYNKLENKILLDTKHNSKHFQLLPFFN